MLNETTEEKYEQGMPWVRVTAYEDFWSELTVTNAEDKLSGRVKQNIVVKTIGAQWLCGRDFDLGLKGC